MGLVRQEPLRRVFEVREPIHLETKSGSLVTIVPDKKFRISVTQAGGHPQFTQFYSVEVTPETYEREIAPARTFVHYEDVQPLLEKGLIKGGSLENAIVLRGDAILSKEPLRFPEELARHKILDLIGDLMLSGKRIMGHVIAVKPGHGPNTEMAKKLAESYRRMDALNEGRKTGALVLGAGVGLTWTDPGNFAIRTYYAQKLGNEVATSAPDKSGRFWIQAVKYF